MSKSDIVFQLQYKISKNKRLGISKWINYAIQKQKADATSLDEINYLNDYISLTNKDVFFNEDSEAFMWNKDGDLLKQEAINKISDLNNNGLFWRGFLSFPPDFAYNHGLITKSDFYSLSNNVIPSLIMDMGLDINNVEWMCALHRDTKHPHIHFCLYEKISTKTSPQYPKYCISNFKSNVGKFLIDNTKFYELRDKTFGDITKNISKEELTKMKNQRLFSDSYRKGLNKLLLNLYETLPKKGRLQYNSKNMEHLKKDLDNIIKYILMHDSVKYEYANYLKLLEKHQQELNQLYGMSDSNKSKKYYNDQLNKLYSKIGNEILDNFKVYSSKDVVSREKAFLSKHIREMKFQSRSDYLKEETKKDVAKDLYRLCIFSGLNDKQTIKVMDNWIQKSKYNINPNDIMMELNNYNDDMTSVELYRILRRLGYDYDRYSKYKSKYFYRELSYKIFVNKAIDHLMYELDKEKKQIVSEMEFELEYK